MGSLGGLDVAFGSNTQICQTNTLIIEAANHAEATVANAALILSRCKEVFPSALKPDYIAFIASGALTEGYYDTAPTEVAQNGVLSAITAVPVAGASMGATANKQRGLAYDHILNVGMLQLSADNAGVVDDLFKDASPNVLEHDENQGFSHQMQGQLMSAQMNELTGRTAGVSSTHGVGGDNGRVMTLNLSPLLTDSDVFGGTEVADMSVITATSTLAAINDALATAAALVSITSIASLV